MVRIPLTTAAFLLALPFAAGAATSAPPADTLYVRQDWAAAAAAYDRVVKAEPGNGRAWYRLGVSLQQSGHADRAIPAYQKAATIGFAPNATWYNLACAYALTHDTEHAFAALDSLTSHGYRQPKALEADADFASIKSDARFAEALARAKKNAFPCVEDPKSHELDFWVGEWNVQDRASGSPVGTSSVQRILGDCVIFENWTGSQGGSGKSFNSYNYAEGWWQQNWVSDGGQTNDFTHGALEGNAMVYHGTGHNGSTTYPTKLSFFNLGPDRVRQFSEYSTDGGKTWQVGYDFLYVRKKEGAAAVK
jgi:tetratricopeptide (TPR) repeat protein